MMNKVKPTSRTRKNMRQLPATPFNENEMELPRTQHPSYWDLTEQLTQYPQWTGQTNYDVAVIGGGITGLTTALLLKETGKKVAVFERYTIGFGTTGGTTGHLSSNPDYGLAGIANNFGTHGSLLAQMAMTEGIDLIEKISRKHQIKCGFRRLPAYFYTENPNGIEEISEEYKSSAEAGTKVTLVPNVPLPFKTYEAMKICHQAQFHSLKYINGLADVINGNGSNIFENTPITNYEDGTPCLLYIDSILNPIKVPTIVVATHTAIGLHILNGFVSPYRSYAIAAKIGAHPPMALFWDNRDPYYYTCFQPDNLSNPNSEHVIIVGGCDHKTGQTTDENQHYQKLEKYVNERFKIQPDQIYSRWSAQWYKSIDGLPYIGRSQSTSNIYMAIGFGGDGLTWGSISAKINCDLILGRNNIYQKLLSPYRHEPLSSYTDFISENANVVAKLAKGWIRYDDDNIVNMKPKEARIIQNGNRKVAVYKDEKGCLHKCSAVCTHMGAILKWNTAEQTWDCPAHGGRFTCKGKLIEGAPMIDLEDLSYLVLQGELLQL